MKLAQLWKKIRLYGLDALFLGLMEKILAALTKYVARFQDKLARAIERLNEKRAALGIADE